MRVRCDQASASGYWRWELELPVGTIVVQKVVNLSVHRGGDKEGFMSDNRPSKEPSSPGRCPLGDRSTDAGTKPGRT
jgi:hypothetical protein